MKKVVLGALALTLMLAPSMTFAKGRKHMKKTKTEHRMHHAKKAKAEKAAPEKK